MLVFAREVTIALYLQAVEMNANIQLAIDIAREYCTPKEELKIMC